MTSGSSVSDSFRILFLVCFSWFLGRWAEDGWPSTSSVDAGEAPRSSPSSSSLVGSMSGSWRGDVVLGWLLPPSHRRRLTSPDSDSMHWNWNSLRWQLRTAERVQRNSVLERLGFAQLTRWVLRIQQDLPLNRRVSFASVWRNSSSARLRHT